MNTTTRNSMTPHYEAGPVRIFHGDCIDVMRELPDNSVDAICTDPPYGLEFMGKEWDAPWQRGDDINADAGLTSTGYTDGGNRLPRPTFTGSTNPKCLRCKGTRRGRRDGTAKVAVCLCEDGGSFPNVRASEMRAFQDWCGEWAAECFRVLKPGGHILAFGGSRTWHRLASAIEDAGFEIRDSIAWLYGSGFPKSMDVSKAIDAYHLTGGRTNSRAIRQANDSREVVGTKLGLPGTSVGQKAKTAFSERVAAEQGEDIDGRARRIGTSIAEGGHRRDLDITAPTTDAAKAWEGWGTALKPAFEPIVVGRKPLQGTVAGNVLAYGVGALNIDATRVATSESLGGGANKGMTSNTRHEGFARPWMDDDEARGAAAARSRENTAKAESLGRWPANVVLDETQAAELDRQSGTTVSSDRPRNNTAEAHNKTSSMGKSSGDWTTTGHADSGGASRFFPTFRYEAKAPGSERPTADGVSHPTVKPLDLMRWLVRLVTPPGGVVLEPFAGSGTTVEACIREGFGCIAIEREADYLPLILKRVRKDHEQSLFGDDWDAA